jgi:hypothetical protein
MRVQMLPPRRARVSRGLPHACVHTSSTRMCLRHAHCSVHDEPVHAPCTHTHIAMRVAPTVLACSLCAQQRGVLHAAVPAHGTRLTAPTRASLPCARVLLLLLQRALQTTKTRAAAPAASAALQQAQSRTPSATPTPTSLQVSGRTTPRCCAVLPGAPASGVARVWRCAGAVPLRGQRARLHRTHALRAVRPPTFLPCMTRRWLPCRCALSPKPNQTQPSRCVSAPPALQRQTPSLSAGVSERRAHASALGGRRVCHGAALRAALRRHAR